MRVKNVVKVMNFHALLRVDSAKRDAERYIFMQNELSKMIDTIINNRNIILDKKALNANNNGKILNIYYGSDFGFCGNLNSVINTELLKDTTSDKIVVGRKLRKNVPNTVMQMSREDLEYHMDNIENVICDGIRYTTFKEINIIYFQYKSVSEMQMVKRKIFPMEMKKGDNDYTDDFSYVGRIEDILFNVVTTYLCYELRLANINCKASENIMRQNVTSESLKKIDEYEEEKEKNIRKIKKQKNFQKVVENYSKMRNKVE